MPAGTYRFAAVTGDGFRAAVGGDWVLAQRWPGLHDRRLVTRTLPAGKVTLRVEFYHVRGPAHFDFRTRAAAAD